MLFTVDTGISQTINSDSILVSSREAAFSWISGKIGEMARLQHHENPRIALLDFFNYLTQEKDRYSETLEESLTDVLYHELPGHVVPHYRISELRLEWNEIYPGSYREPLAEDLAGQANADWMITGTYENTQDTTQLRIELYELALEKILWQSVIEHPLHSSTEVGNFISSSTPDKDFQKAKDKFETPETLSARTRRIYPIPHPGYVEPPESLEQTWFHDMLLEEDLSPPPEGMLRIPGGEYLMGNPMGNPDEQPDHLVSLPSFFLDLHEVTNKDFDLCRTCVRGHGGFDSTKPEQPVVYVDWANALEYCQSLGRRLPTEAEWEYAARAGSSYKFPFSDDPEALSIHAWFEENTLYKGLPGPQPVATKKANPWGLYDMQGNVMEWVIDYYAQDYTHNLWNNYRSKGPSEPENREYPLRVVRGGAWGGHHDAGTADGLRVSRRYAFAPWVRSFQIGFRCAADDSTTEKTVP